MDQEYTKVGFIYPIVKTIGLSRFRIQIADRIIFTVNLLSTRPNFLFLLSDQHRADWMGCSSELPLKTPTIDRLAAEGTRFTRAITPSPVCSPARACLATGLDYEHCGFASIHENLPLDKPTYYQILREAGYQVTGVGKFDLHKPDMDWGLDGKNLLQEYGFTDGIDSEGKGDAIWAYRKDGKPRGPYLQFLEDRGLLDRYVSIYDPNSENLLFEAVNPLPDDAYCDTWIAQNGLDMLATFSKDQPWHLVVNFAGPHDPYDVTESMRAKWKDVDFPQPVANDTDDPEIIRLRQQHYAAMIENIDTQVGRYLTLLEKRGELENTVIFYSSDHGEMLGDHPIMSWRTMPGPPLWFPILIAVPTILMLPLVFSFLPEMLGTFIQRLLSFPTEGRSFGIYGYEEFWLNIWGSITLVVCLVLASWSSFAWVERISTIVLVTMVLCVVVSVFVLGFDIIGILKGMLIPSVPSYKEWITSDSQFSAIASRNPWLEISIYLSAVGGGIGAYLGYVSTIREKKWGLAGGEPVSKKDLDRALLDPEQLRLAKLWVRAPFLDASISFFFVILVTLLFAVLGTVVLHADHVIPDGSEFLTLQERYLTNLHPQLAILYRISVFLAFIGTLYGAFIVYRYTVADGLIGIFGHRLPPASSHKWIRWVYSYCFIVGAGLMWLPVHLSGNIIDRLTFAGLFTGSTGCGLWCFAMLWSDYSRIPKPLRMRLGLKISLIISGVVLLALGIRSIVAFFS
jgi:hypothetical protein